MRGLLASPQSIKVLCQERSVLCGEQQDIIVSINVINNTLKTYCILTKYIITYFPVKIQNALVTIYKTTKHPFRNLQFSSIFFRLKLWLDLLDSVRIQENTDQK